MTTKLPDEAKLTEKEIHEAVVTPDHPWGVRLASFEPEFYSVADAATAKALRVFRERLRAVAVHDFYTGTSPDSPHWTACRLCDWTWHYEEPDLHDPGCLLWEAPNA